jgi:cytochrome c oxidase cbb3-type subunit III
MNIEEDPLLDHEYDGIKEYDNPLPGWWVAMFWLTVLFAIPYVAYFHGKEGRSIHDGYQAELAAYAAQLVATYGNLAADEQTILRYAQDPVAMSGMASVFRSKCAQCHADDGSGMVGPNLTDDAWLNVKQVPDIAAVIRDGLELKGMPAWGERLSETETVLMAAFVASLRAEPVDGKAPQGDVLPPWPDVEPEPAEPTGDESSARAEGSDGEPGAL